MDKAQLRRELQNCLLSITSQQRSEKSRKACRNLVSIPQFQSASTVMMFLSLPHEVDTSEAILNAWQLGKDVAVPKVSWQQKHMIAVQINSLETGISTEASGLRNPIARVPVAFEEIDLVVTPGLGFDKNGNRLGRGGSYYDRFFANTELKASRCGFGFTEQLVEKIPVEEHDEPVDIVVTEKEIIYIKDSREAGFQ
ncbi:MAG: 5-formyltetrahydrofolate cyclo-ligase [Planctomycetes bacterium]|nr:5-formyltetrahydrofolate cyclo-ligase [Planctomycetota bacterium]MBL7145959.1 5-formyltetrahydrofolate cyclo-ligase [Phycisphaerae bacterium]